MKSVDSTLRFFLGTNTPQGFVSRFDQLADAGDGWRLTVIKGGPGSGKSVMLGKIAEHMRALGKHIELIHCATDIELIDGVILPELRFAIADGTPPHVIEPKYPGAFETIVDTASCLDEQSVYAARERIVELSESFDRCNEHCCRFLSAASSLSDDTYRIALESVNTAKLAGYCARLAEREFKPLKNRQGRERIRFLTAITSSGVTSFTATAKAMCDRIYLINDDYGAVSRLLLYSARSKALAAGYDVISCYCPLGPYDKLEHMFVPTLGLGFLTSNSFHDYVADIDAYRIVNYQRFSNREKLSSGKKRALFNRKAAAQMLGQAELLMRDAKSLRDEIKGYYINATDFARLDELADRIISELESREKLT